MASHFHPRAMLLIATLALSVSDVKSQIQAVKKEGAEWLATIDSVCSQWEQEFKNLPPIKYKWEQTDEKGVVRLYEFCNQGTKYFCRVLKDSENDREQLPMIAYDGQSYYCLVGEQLSISSSPASGTIKNFFPMFFHANPLTQGFSNFFRHDFGKFELKAMTSHDTYKALFEKGEVNIKTGASGITEIFFNNRQGAKLSYLFNPVNMMPESLDGYHETGKHWKWFVEKWQRVELKSGLFVTIPQITHRYIYKDDLSSEIVSRYVAKVIPESVKVLSENLPDEAFRIPTTMAESILDLDIGATVKGGASYKR